MAKKNPQDETLRNLHAQQKVNAKDAKRDDELEQRVAKIETFIRLNLANYGALD